MIIKYTIEDEAPDGRYCEVRKYPIKTLKNTKIKLGQTIQLENFSMEVTGLTYNRFYWNDKNVFEEDCIGYEKNKKDEQDIECKKFFTKLKFFFGMRVFNCASLPKTITIRNCTKDSFVEKTEDILIEEK